MVQSLANVMHGAPLSLSLSLSLSLTQNGLSCPTCKKIHGVRTGDMPDGNMSVTYHSYSLPGHEGEGTIEIIYNFRAGTYVSTSPYWLYVLVFVCVACSSVSVWWVLPNLLHFISPPPFSNCVKPFFVPEWCTLQDERISSNLLPAEFLKGKEGKREGSFHLKDVLSYLLNVLALTGFCMCMVI